MAITYKWDISQMSAHIQSEGEDNVIYRVDFVYTGSEESGGVTYSSSNSGFQNYTYVGSYWLVRRIIRCSWHES
jgi:hypothetical protein